MDQNDILSILCAHEQDLCARGVCRAGLFGSRARGDHNSNSDTDIMIELDPAVPIGIYEYVSIKEYIASLFDVPVDVVSGENLKPFIRPAAFADVINAF